MFLMKNLGAKRVLEDGTLGGYLAIWIGVVEVLPADEELIIFECVEKNTEA